MPFAKGGGQLLRSVIPRLGLCDLLDPGGTPCPMLVDSRGSYFLQVVVIASYEFTFSRGD